MSCKYCDKECGNCNVSQGHKMLHSFALFFVFLISLLGWISFISIAPHFFFKDCTHIITNDDRLNKELKILLEDYEAPDGVSHFFLFTDSRFDKNPETKEGIAEEVQ